MNPDANPPGLPSDVDPPSDPTPDAALPSDAAPSSVASSPYGTRVLGEDEPSPSDAQSTAPPPPGMPPLPGTPPLPDSPPSPGAPSAQGQGGAAPPPGQIPPIPNPGPTPGPSSEYGAGQQGAPGYAPPGYAPPGYGTPGYGPPGYGAPGYTPRPLSPQEEQQWGMYAHLSSLCAFIGVPFGTVLGPLIVMLTKGKESAHVATHAKHALNFHLSMTIYSLVCIPLCFVLIGIPLLIAVAIMSVVCTIMAGLAANNGQDYKYPLTIELVK